MVKGNNFEKDFDFDSESLDEDELDKFTDEVLDDEF